MKRHLAQLTCLRVVESERILLVLIRVHRLVAAWTLPPGRVSMRYDNKRLEPCEPTVGLRSLIASQAPEPMLCHLLRMDFHVHDQYRTCQLRGRASFFSSKYATRKHELFEVRFCCAIQAPMIYLWIRLTSFKSLCSSLQEVCTK